MFRLLNILYGEIKFSINEKNRQNEATLSIDGISRFHYQEKIYELDSEASTDFELFWRNKYSVFSLSASLINNFRKVNLRGYYRDDVSTNSLTMSENYMLSSENYEMARQSFVEILLRDYKNKENLIVKSGLSLITGAIAYSVFGAIGLLTIPLVFAKKETQPKPRSEFIINVMDKHQDKTIKELQIFLSEL